MLKNVIAIDGPVGVGKSTVAKLVAKRLGYLFLNTGDMYRALTWSALSQGVDINDKRRVVQFLKKEVGWKFKKKDGRIRVVVGDQELNRVLRSERISRATPTVAQIPAVRQALRKMQRDIALAGRVVLEGRDTTTHVTPDARLKVYLDASIAERARRRWAQLKEDGKRVKLESIYEAARLRDLREKKRKIMPSFRTHGTLVLDTSSMSLEAVVEKILSFMS